MKKKVVSLVIPAYNEQDNIQPLYQQVRENLDPIERVDFEFIFANDGSTDQTYQEIKSLQEKDGRVKLVNLYRNFGHEIAMTAGMDYSNGDCVIFMDADLQHPPSMLPEMISLWLEGNDIILTRRVDNQDRSVFKVLTSKLFYKVLNLLSDTHIPSNFPDFRLIDKKFIDILKRMDERDRMFRGMLNWIGVSNCPVLEFIAQQRHAGQSKYSLGKLFELAMNGVVQFSVKPLKMATFLGMIAICLAFFMAVYTAVEHYVINAPKTGYSTIVILILFMGSMQLIVLGIIGEYIGRIHLEVKKRPLYIADFHSKTAHEQKQDDTTNGSEQ